MTFSNDKEVWKTIPQFPNYEASTLGRIRSKARQEKASYTNPHTGEVSVYIRKRNSKILKTSPRKIYWMVTLYKNDDLAYQRYVHRLIARTFLGKPPNGKNHVLHEDDDGHNNCVGNLRWGSHKDNMEDMSNKQRRSGEKHCNATVTNETVARIDEYLFAGFSCAFIAKKFDTTLNVVKNISRGLTWTHVTGRGVNIS